MRNSNTEIHILGTLISEGTQMVDVVDVLLFLMIIFLIL